MRLIKRFSLFFFAALLAFAILQFSFGLMAQEEEDEELNNVGIIKDITPGNIQLEQNQVYQSPYIDVRKYRYATFFILEDKILNSPPDKPSRYQLDVFYSINTEMSGVRNFGTNYLNLLYKGWQEFGAEEAREEGKPEGGKFTVMTTGATSGGRALYSPVYGPYARVELTNLTDDDEARSFRVKAYLIN